MLFFEAKCRKFRKLILILRTVISNNPVNRVLMFEKGCKNRKHRERVIFIVRFGNIVYAQRLKNRITKMPRKRNNIETRI